MSQIKAGAGMETIKIPETVFPIEGYLGEKDKIHVRVLLLDYGEKIAIVSLELPSVRDEKVLKIFRKVIADLTGTREEFIWICTTHNLATIHIPPEKSGKSRKLIVESLMEAIAHACKKAVFNLQPAKAGIETGSCDVNTNRDIKGNQGWWNGLNGEGAEDKLLTVYKFENENEEPIAILYHYPVKCCVVAGSFYADGTRLSTSEIAGKSSEVIENKYGVPALFFMGAAADMVPKKCAVYTEVDENGDLKDIDLGMEEGLRLREELGTILGDAVCECADRAVCQKEVFLAHKKISYWYKGQQFYNEGRPYHPTPNYQYIPAEDEEIQIWMLCIGYTVIFGMMPETTAIIGIKLRERTSPVLSLVAAMVNGGKDYMADELSYERKTFSGTHSVFARGSAERFINDAAELVREVYAEILEEE